MWMDGKSVTVKKGSTVYHAFIEALRDSGITQSGAASGYVRSMTKGGVTYGEFTHGDNSGWLYKVNGVLPNGGADPEEAGRRRRHPVVLHHRLEAGSRRRAPWRTRV